MVREAFRHSPGFRVRGGVVIACGMARGAGK